MAQTDLHFTFNTTGGESDDPSNHFTFDVVEFNLVEELSQPFKLTVELISHDPAVDFGAVLDQGATLTIWEGKKAVRHIHGVVSDFTQGKTGFRRTRYSASIEPNIARIQLTSDWRIFQQSNVQAIIASVFKGDRISNFEINAQSPHAQREYCVQAGVTNFEFVQRLAAQEGFVYAFKHEASSHQLLMTDIVQTLGSIGDGASILYNPNPAGDKQEPALHTFLYQERVRTASQTQRDYHFKNPKYDQQHQSQGKSLRSEGGTHQSTHYERYDYPGQYKADEAGKPFTITKIQSLRRDAQIATAVGDDARIQPGFAFNLTGHPRSGMNIYWRPVKVIHTGKQFTAGEEEAATTDQSTFYEQTATLVPATADWKAAIPQDTKIHGSMMAHVTGPSGEEIYVDEFGRVKVQFPWDREGSNDDHSSCWIRVSQNWAGAGWGHMAIPRVGQEVIVSFLDGDESQPIITGRSYDANHPPPYALPEHKTKMTIRSKTHKGHGFNELTFEDEKDQEEVYIHAQRNKRIHVEHDKSELVEHDEKRVVGNNQFFDVAVDRSKRIGQDETLKIGRDRKEQIEQDVFITIGRNEDRKILSSQRESITADQIITIGKDQTLSIEGIQSIEAKTRLQTMTKDYVLQGTDRILIRGPMGKIIFDAAGITLEAPVIQIKGSLSVTGGGTDQVEAIKSAIQNGAPFVEECPDKKKG